MQWRLAKHPRREEQPLAGPVWLLIKSVKSDQMVLNLAYDVQMMFAKHCKEHQKAIMIIINEITIIYAQV